MTEQTRSLSDPLEPSQHVLLEQFKQKVIAHPQLIAVHKEVLEYLLYPTPDLVVYVFGPAGVGKTTLCRGIVSELIRMAQFDLTQDPGRLVVGTSEVPPPHKGIFDWKDCYIQTLESLQEPLIEFKTQKKGGDHQDNRLYIIDRTAGPPELRRAVVSCFKHRRLISYLWDEAQHFTKVPSVRHLNTQSDNIKWIAEKSKVVPVLVGTYDLLALSVQNGQLARRKGVIYFSPYLLNTEEDRKTFQEIIVNLQQYTPLPGVFDLSGEYQYFHKFSLGCFGMLKEWWYRTLKSALIEGKSTLTRDDFDQHKARPDDLLRVAREIREGEARFADPLDWETSLEQLLYQRPNTPKPKSSSEEAKASTEAKAKRGRSRPGQRNPTRDTVGGQDSDS